MVFSGQELFYAVRWRYLGRYLGQFFLVIATLQIATFVVSLFHFELRIAFSYLAMIVGLYLVGFYLSRLKVSGHMQMNEAMVLAALVFLVVPSVAAIPLVIHGLSPLDAWFETVSAATTTGLSTVSDVSSQPATFLFARAWMQWYGGLGIVVLSLALVVRPGMTALRLANQEVTDDLVGGTHAHARRVLIVYLWLTGAGLLAWVLLGGRPLEGLHYILSAVSTGGFAPTSASFADLTDIRLAWVVTLTALAGAVPLALFYRSWHEGWRHFLRNTEVRTLLAVSLCMPALLAVLLWSQGMTYQDVLVHAPLMALSAQTTSGFSSLDPGVLDAGSKAILILSMAIGGGVGSTAGGFKLLRLLILAGIIYRCLKTMSMPSNAVVNQKLGRRRIDANEVQDALMIILLFIMVVFVSWFFFLFYGYAPMDALFEVVSATGTVGLSVGVTEAGMPSILKIVLCADMLLGRLEFVAWLVFFYYRTWVGRKRGHS